MKTLWVAVFVSLMLISCQSDEGETGTTPSPVDQDISTLCRPGSSSTDAGEVVWNLALPGGVRADGLGTYTAAFSPDRHRIAFTAHLLGQTTYPTKSDLYLINTDGSGLGNLKVGETGGIIPQEPAWSPDGKQIAFVDHLTQGKMGVYVVNTDGTGLKQLSFPPDGYLDYYVTWGLGQRLAFVRAHGNDNDQSQLHLMDANGSNQQLISLTSIWHQAHHPAWSSDGKTLAVVGLVRPDANTVEAHLYLVSADGQKVRQLTFGDAAFNPTWSRNSQMLSYGKGHGMIWLVEVATGKESEITSKC